jgi:galactose mutarotase-like enzyme
MYVIENGQLRVIIHPKGAELQSIVNKKHSIEYMWSGDPAFWGKRSPVLFPIIGTLKKDTYFFNDKPYNLPRHGFARDMVFKIAGQQEDAIDLEIGSDENTLLHYPFLFKLNIRYQLNQEGLSVSYRVGNKSETDLYFSVGGHPAFKVPLVDGTGYTDYYLEFNADQELSHWPISPEGLIEKKPYPLIMRSGVLPLTREMFFKDALVFKHPESSLVSLKASKTGHGLDFDISGFSYLGIWAAKNADFVCIEPWCGIADSVDSDQQLIYKEGINRLSPGELFEREWKVRFF